MLLTRPRLCTVFGIPSLYYLHILLLTSLYLPYVIGVGVFEVKLGEMLNPGGRDANRHCCVGSESNGHCTSPCNTVIKTCLRQFSPAHPSDCTYGYNVSSVLGSNSFVLTTGNIIRFPISSNWPGSFSLKVTAITAGTKKTIIEALAKRSSFDANQQWDNYTLTSSTKGFKITLSFSFRFTCSKNNYGRDCSKNCVPRNDRYGHFRCDADGKRVCLDGWGSGDSDTFCENPVCNPSCSPNGNCMAPNTCRCSSGWQGTTCNQCKLYPGCVHGTCKKAWGCDCNPGWGGSYCDLELDYCGRNNPCKHGSCRNTAPGRYKCLCYTGYEGLNCDSERNECASNPCQNGGNCTDKFAGFTCKCPAGYRGKQCEINIDDCKDNACANGATCVDDILSYSCLCPVGFTGKTCEILLPTEAPTTDTRTTDPITTDPITSSNTTHRVTTTIPTTTAKSHENDTVVGGQRRDDHSDWQQQVINIVIPVVTSLILLICFLVGCVLWRFYRKQCCCCGTATASNRDPEEPNTRTTVKHVDSKELSDDRHDMKQCRASTSKVKTNTPDIIINFVPSRQHQKNVNTERASRTRKGKEAKQADFKPLGESRNSLELNDIIPDQDLGELFLPNRCFDKGFWQEVEVDI